MRKNKEKSTHPALDRFPFSTIITRWLFLGAELGIALYFVFDFKFDLGLLFIIYALICGTVLLPLFRCVKCHYYGKLCNFGWGVWVSRIFPKSDNTEFSSAHGLSFLFWPLRILPIGFGSIQVVGAVKFGLEKISEGLTAAYTVFIDSLDFFDLGALAAYLIIIYLHRIYYRSRSCSRCHQLKICPVYNYEIISDDTKES